MAKPGADTPNEERFGSGYTSDNENLKGRDNEAPPRPATEPDGAEASQDSAKTATDPGSGQGGDAPPAPNQGPRRE